jgi:opacity protein-like surface antigen
MKKILGTVLFALVAAMAYAADITGDWKGTADFGSGPVERSFTFKVDGKKLTGETSSEMMGKSVITEGVIDGNDVSFTITGKLQGNEMTMHYKGTVHGNEMTLTTEANGQSIEWKCKKAS